MWKHYPSGAWRWLKLTLYVICKEKCNHRAIVSVATANPPLHFSLSVSYFVSSLHFIFPSFPLLFYFRHASFFFIPSLSLCRLILCSSPLSLSPSPCWSFLVFCFVVTSLLSGVFCHLLLGSCRFAHCHRHTNTDINKSSLCEVPEVRDEYDSQNPQKSYLHGIFTVHYFTWKIILTHLAKSSKAGTSNFPGIGGLGTVFRQRCT